MSPRVAILSGALVFVEPTRSSMSGLQLRWLPGACLEGSLPLPSRPGELLCSPRLVLNRLPVLITEEQNFHPWLPLISYSSTTLCGGRRAQWVPTRPPVERFPLCLFIPSSRETRTARLSLVLPAPCSPGAGSQLSVQMLSGSASSPCTAPQSRTASACSVLCDCGAPVLAVVNVLVPLASNHTPFPHF